MWSQGKATPGDATLALRRSLLSASALRYRRRRPRLRLGQRMEDVVAFWIREDDNRMRRMRILAVASPQGGGAQITFDRVTFR